MCAVDFRPQHEDRYRRYLKLCHPCRMNYSKQRYHKYYVPYFNALSPERQETIKKARYIVWKQWVQTHIDRRREQARRSYHKRRIAIGGAK